MIIKNANKSSVVAPVKTTVAGNIKRINIHNVEIKNGDRAGSKSEVMDLTLKTNEGLAFISIWKNTHETDFVALHEAAAIGDDLVIKGVAKWDKLGIKMSNPELEELIKVGPEAEAEVSSKFEGAPEQPEYDVPWNE